MVIKRAKQKGITFGYCDTLTGQRVYPPTPVSKMTDLPGAEQSSGPAIVPDGTPGDIHQIPAQSDLPDASESTSSDIRLTVFPPLNQATIIPRDQHSVKFKIVLDKTASKSTSSEAAAQVSIWHNHDGEHNWAELPLTSSSDDEKVLVLDGSKSAVAANHVYTAELTGLPKHGHVVSFTAKYRADSTHEWMWIKDSSGIQDGTLHYQTTDYAKHSSYDLKHWFSDISPDIQIDVERPETDNTFLYSLTSPVSAAAGDDSAWQHHQLGKAQHSTQWFSLVRLWTPWLAPRQGSGKLYLDKDAVLLSFLRSDGSHVVCLALSGIDDVVSTFFSDEDGNIIVKARNDSSKAASSRVLVAVGESFEVANAAVMYHARKIVRAFDAEDVDQETQALIDDKAKPQWLEEWYDGLAYCTWNGIGQNLTSQKIYDALDALAKEKISITNLIIDDNWQWLSKGETQFARAWSDFEANPEGFPEGLKATTTEIRKRHPNINHIAVWHALLGYWGGIDPEGRIAKNYKTIEVEKEAGVAGGIFTVVAAEDAKRMYDNFYEFLALSGIDSVKTDAQFFLDLVLHAPDRRALTTAYQDAWTIAHLRHFSSRAISCMSQFPQILFYSQLPKNKPRLLVRNSDDFFPDIDASHPWHIFCNAHNALFAQHLNVLPDWDMFQTVGKWAAFHAAARCVSGGPIYFTDEPGKHDFKLLDQMTARTARGRTVILRPHIIGKSINPYNEYSSRAILKVGTYVGYARTGTGILGVFNVSKNPLSEFVPLSDFPGTESGDYIIGSFLADEFSQPMSRQYGDPTEVVVNLVEGGWDILTAYPLRKFTLGTASVSVAMLGLRGKMTGAAAVTGYDAYIESNGRLRVWAAVKALGVLGIWISDLEKRSVVDDFMVCILGKPISIDRVSVKGQVLEIDVAKAWEDSKEDPGWSNEVSLEVFVNGK